MSDLVKRISEIRRRLLTITPGPWRVRAEDLSTVESANEILASDMSEVCDTGFGGGNGGLRECRANADFIAHAPDDIQFLIDELTRFRGMHESKAT